MDSVPLANASNLAVTIGGMGAEVRYAGTDKWKLASQTKIEAVVPEGLPTGAVDVVVTVGTRASRPGVTLSVR